LVRLEGIISRNGAKGVGDPITVSMLLIFQMPLSPPTKSKIWFVMVYQFEAQGRQMLNPVIRLLIIKL
jgi:hypothetical protein